MAKLDKIAAVSLLINTGAVSNTATDVAVSATDVCSAVAGASYVGFYVILFGLGCGLFMYVIRYNIPNISWVVVTS